MVQPGGTGRVAQPHGSLGDEIRAKAAHPPKRCVIARIADSMDAQDRADLLAALDDRPVNRKGGVPATVLVAVLRNRGHEVSESAVSNHRGGRCPCGPR